MKTRIEEIDKMLQALHAERDLLESEAQAKDAQGILDILPRCNFMIDHGLNIEMFVNKEDEDGFLKLIGSLGRGYFHFTAPLTAQIKLRVDDNRIGLQFDPALTDSERFREECDKYFQFKQIVAFLKENKVKKSQFNFAPLTRHIKQLEELVAKAKKDLQFVKENI